MIAYLLHGRPEQNPLKEVQVLGYHGDHIYIPALGKTLYGGFQFGAGKRMKAMLYILKIILEELHIGQLFLTQFFPFFGNMENPYNRLAYSGHFQ